MTNVPAIPTGEFMGIAIRAYVCKQNSVKPAAKSGKQRKRAGASEWTLVFDTETTTDATQNLRFGTYQVRKGMVLHESGLFYNQEGLTAHELITLKSYAEKPWHPRVQIKHVSSRDAFIQFAGTMGQRATRGQRKKGEYQPVRRGFFIDVKTLAAALTSQSYSLDSLAKALGVAQKHKTDEHGKTLTQDYIAYAVQDTQTTWECYCKLMEMYALRGLTSTKPHNIHSEASLGKAYLREMGIKPWQRMQPDFPPELLGNIMSSYFGGRSEVHIRKQAVQIYYCDFLSMYPTVCTLMRLWQFVTAQGMVWHDSTTETQELLANIIITDLQKPATWRLLTTLVQVKPNGEIFPVRAKYGYDAQYTIGANHLAGEEPLWFTLADCIAAKVLTGKTPEVLQAISFTPGKQQENLKAVCIAGNDDYKVNPAQDDFFKRVIDLRRSVKARMKNESGQKREILDSQQLALKILANSTSYGIFVELNVSEERTSQELQCFGSGGDSFPINQKKFEDTGAFFHPLLATLITGAARLLLAITERLATEEGLSWAFCDTDSMALAKPEGMAEDEFYKRATRVQKWFTAISPYGGKPDLLQVEDQNYSLTESGKIEPLFCYAISSKRYALYNLDANGKTVLRKVSAHGLGHLRPPYEKVRDGYLKDVEPWQQDLWQEIIEAALGTRQPAYASLLNFNAPAVSRYGATTPAMLKWFSDYNEGKPYSEQVKPFNFMLSMFALPE